MNGTFLRRSLVLVLGCILEKNTISILSDDLFMFELSQASLDAVPINTFPVQYPSLAQAGARDD